MALDRAGLERVFGALLAHHGAQFWWPAESPFEVVVGALLIQRTAWRNAEIALAALRAADLLSPAALAASTPARLEALVRPAGFYRQKAARLHALAGWLLAQGGMDTLATLDDRTLEETWLARPGIGAETAAVICLYAFDRPLFVVDAYARRLFGRLGWIAGDESERAVREACERALGGDTAVYNEYHALVVAHAKSHCRAVPRCDACVLRRHCAHARAAVSR
ncbi:MAG: endonuclease III domain-containing protein [Gammaproteobacteria bacterium]